MMTGLGNPHLVTILLKKATVTDPVSVAVRRTNYALLLNLSTTVITNFPLTFVKSMCSTYTSFLGTSMFRLKHLGTLVSAFIL